jgi:hypothetical protein
VLELVAFVDYCLLVAFALLLLQLGNSFENVHFDRIDSKFRVLGYNFRNETFRILYKEVSGFLESLENFSSQLHQSFHPILAT